MEEQSPKSFQRTPDVLNYRDLVGLLAMVVHKYGGEIEIDIEDQVATSVGNLIIINQDDLMSHKIILRLKLEKEAIKN